MSNTEHDTDAGLEDFTAGWAKVLESEPVTVAYAVIGLTNFGEHPVQSTRLAEVLDVPVNEAEALARQWGWPGTRAGDGLITVSPGRAKSAPRRQLQIGDRRVGVSGWAPDAFLYAPLVRPSLHLEGTCPVTGTPIRVVFTPSGVASADPGGAVVPMPAAQTFDRIEEMNIQHVDADLCVQYPLYSSAEAAQEWLDAHPGCRVFPIRQAWDLSFLRDWRDRMPALLNLAN